MSSSINDRARGRTSAGSNWMVRVIIAVLLLGVVCGFFVWSSTPTGNLLSDTLSVPLNSATAAKVEINPGDGNLTIGRLQGSEQVLAGGTLQYLDSQGFPKRSVDVNNGLATLALRGGDKGQPFLQFPWSACNGATDWQVDLNPNVPSDIRAVSAGGNLALNLVGMAVTGVSAETGGGNVVVALPEKASNLKVKAATGGGNVVVQVPSGMAARVYATSGLGKVIVDPRFSKLDGNTYQSPDYESAVNRVDITAQTGAGNVSVETN